MDKTSQKQLEIIKAKITPLLKCEFSDEELLDIYISLFYLGKAIYKFNIQKGAKNVK